jgi:precorrin-2 dehydrogenase/sirohydrochlorin ferrochelatase
MDQVRCVVVGGGRVAARKVRALRAADARVVVIAPELCRSLQTLREQDEIEVVERHYRSGDLKDAFLAIAATDDEMINRRVWKEARQRGLLVNVVDEPERCNFIAPSVVRRGPLTLAISTSGRCPALSRHLRQHLERQFGPAYGVYVELLGELRDEVVGVLSLDERRAFWEEVFGSGVLELLVSGEEEKARCRAQDILQRHLPGVA